MTLEVRLSAAIPLTTVERPRLLACNTKANAKMLLLLAVRPRVPVWILALCFGAKILAAQTVPTAVFLDASGATRSFSFGFPELTNAGGVLADVGDGSGTATSVASAQNPQRDVYVAGIDPFGGVWINVLESASQLWLGWIPAGSALFTPSSVDIALGPDGTAWIVAGSSTADVWLNSYTAGGGFSGWILIAQHSFQAGLGTRYSNPVIRVTPDSSVYLVMRFSDYELEFFIAGIKAGKYIPGGGFTFIQGGISITSPILPRGPAAAIGSDGALYVCITHLEAGSRQVTMSRISGTTWGPEYTAPGQVSDLPRLATGAGKIYAVALDPLHNVVTNEFLLGSGNGWQTWTYANGSLETISSATVGDRLYVAGFDIHDDLWWYEAGGAGWIYYGNRGIATSFLTASPR